MDNSMVRNVWQIMPDLRQVTFYSRTSQGQFDDYDLFHVRRKPVAKDYATGPRGAVTKQQKSIFQIWKEDLEQADAPDPKAGDKIEEADGTTWIVDSPIDIKLIRNVFNLGCIKALES